MNVTEAIEHLLADEYGVARQGRNMALTIESAQDIKPGRSYLYQYVVSIHPFGPTGRYKGQIEPFRSRFGHPVFEFLAPNDETTYAYLLLHFRQSDERPLMSARKVEEARVKTWAEGDPGFPVELPRA